VSDAVTEVRDQIEFEYQPDWKYLWTRLIYAPIMLRFLFLYRSWVTRRAVQAGN